MLDAANVLMNNYQIVAARTPPVNVTAAPAATIIPPAPPQSEESKPTTSATKEDKPSTSTEATAKYISEIKTDDMPSTSTAAAALLNTKSPTTTTTEQSLDIPVAKHNEVTIEDLGGEEHIDTVTAASASAATSNIDASTLGDSTAEHINELRKRRLKFLEERNKTSAE